jgi:two-component system, OmpR family, response regulator
VRILLVEDDAVLGRGLTTNLEQQRYAVDWLASGGKVVEQLLSGHYDLLILDLGLPEMSGLTVLKALRTRADDLRSMPVLVITASESVPERVIGLDAGADDYLTKPFALDELNARVRALIRRRHAASSNLIQLGRLSLDLASRQARIDDVDLELSSREISLLRVLMLNAGRPVGKDQILESLVNRDAELSTNAIEVYVHRVRKKLDAAGIRVRTLRGIGYCLERIKPDL